MMEGMAAFPFAATIIYWRGPAPFVFAAMPEAVAAEIRAVWATASYGWGCIPVSVEIEDKQFTTALIPRDGTYLLPLKVAVRRNLPWLAVGGSVAGVLRPAIRRP